MDLLHDIEAKDITVGRIILPSNMERSKYINRCYDLGRVSLITAGAGIIRDASVCMHCMNDLVFPVDHTGTGSAVVFISIPSAKEYIVYGVLKEMNVINSITEHQFSIGKSTDEGHVEVKGDAEDGSLVFSAKHSKNGGSVTINIGQDEADGLLTFNVVGDILFDTDRLKMSLFERIDLVFPKSGNNEVTRISYAVGSGLSYSDEYGNKVTVDASSHTINHKKKVVLGSDNEPAVLGNTAKGLVEELIDAILAMQSMAGTYPVVINPADILKLNTIKAKLGNMLSQYVKIK